MALYQGRSVISWYNSSGIPQSPAANPAEVGALSLCRARCSSGQISCCFPLRKPTARICSSLTTPILHKPVRVPPTSVWVSSVCMLPHNSTDHSTGASLVCLLQVKTRWIHASTISGRANHFPVLPLLFLIYKMSPRILSCCIGKAFCSSCIQHADEKEEFKSPTHSSSTCCP